MGVTRPVPYLLLLSVAVVGQSAAQAPGAPVSYSPNALRGLEVAVEWRPDQGGDGRLMAHFSRLSVGGAFGRRIEGRSAWSASIGYPVLRSTAWEYAASVEAGYGVTSGGGDAAERQLVLGVAASLNTQNNLLGALMPWAAVSFRHFWDDDAGDSGPGLGASLGLELRTASALRMIDRLGGITAYVVWEVVAPLGGAVQLLDRSRGVVGLSMTFASLLPRAIRP